MGDLLGMLPALQAALNALALRHRVPGAMLSIYDGDHTVDLVTGVANAETGVEVTPSTLFQIGSLTKVYTATLMMRLADQGRLDLDAPVRSYLPSFQLSDEDAGARVTPRHLLSHSSGIVCDHHADFGPGDDCLDLYVASLKEHEQVYRPGLMFSYSNSAFNVAGRVIEAVCGKPFDAALAEELLDPLGLASTTVRPEQMLRFRYAVGHIAGPRGAYAVPPKVLMYRSTEPAGGRTSASASDVLRFARMHIDSGRAPDGTMVVSEAGIRAMRTPGLPVPGYDSCNIGLGWIVSEFGGEPAMFHTGGTIGQAAFLTVLPERPFAVCLLTNSDAGGRLWSELGRWVFKTIADVELPKEPQQPVTAPSLDLRPYAATYERLSQRFDVVAESDHLRATITTSGLLGEESATDVDLWPIDAQQFYASVAGTGMIVTFLEPDADGRPSYLHCASRAAVRRS